MRASSLTLIVFILGVLLVNLKLTNSDETTTLPSIISDEDIEAETESSEIHEDQATLGQFAHLKIIIEYFNCYLLIIMIIIN